MANPPNQTLPLSNVINVTVIAPGQSLGSPNMSALALISQDAPIGWSSGQTYGIYTDSDQVATDFGSTSNAFAIANAIFAQTPNILTGGGYLVIIPRLTSPSLESVQDALIRMSDVIFFEGVLIDEEMDSQASAFASLSAYCQSAQKIFFYASSVIANLQPGSILDLVRQAGNTYTRCLYYGNELLNGASVQQTQIFAGAYAGRGLSVDFAGSDTMATMNLKALATITPDQTIGQTQWQLAKTAGVDIYPSTSGVPGVQCFGANSFFDQVYGRAWFGFQLAVEGFNYLAQTSTKIPQTEDGIIGLQNAYAQACAQGIRVGYLAPGAWTLSTKFGNPADLVRNVADFGYYLYHTPVAKQSSADRAQRKAPLIQIAAQEAGAVQQSSVIVNVNA